MPLKAAFPSGGKKGFRWLNNFCMSTLTAELPVSAKEVTRSNSAITLSRADLPWLPAENVRVPLVNFAANGREFLFGSEISDKDLVKAASHLDAHRSEICNNLLHTHLPEFAEGYSEHVKVVANHRSRQPIFYAGNKGGQRVYFMRFGKIDGKPVIVKVAVCDKARQEDVLVVLTGQSRRQIKGSSKL